MPRNFDRLSIRPGEMTEMEIGFSEVACHLRVAGKTMTVELLSDGRMAQLFDERGKKFSMPITYGEAGIYRDNAGYYHY